MNKKEPPIRRPETSKNVNFETEITGEKANPIKGTNYNFFFIIDKTNLIS